MFCFILHAVHLGTLRSEFTLPSTGDTLNSIDDLFAPTFVVHVLKEIERFDWPFSSAQTKFLMTRTHYYSGSFNDLVIIRDRNDMAYVLPRLLFHRFFANVSYRILPGVSVYFPEPRFRLNEPPPYGHLFATAFVRAMGAGALDKVARERRLGVFRTRAGPEPLSLTTFGGTFVVWFCRCVLSFVSFFRC